MPTLQLENAIKDFALWGRRSTVILSTAAGWASVARCPPARASPLRDRGCSSSTPPLEAERCGAALRERGAAGAPALSGAPRVRIVDVVEDHPY